MRKALLTKNKLGFIDGTLTLSSPLVSTPSTIHVWIRCDNMVGTWLTNSVSPMIQASIFYEDTTMKIWIDLREWFSQRMVQESSTCRSKLQSFIKVKLLLLISLPNSKSFEINCRTIVPFLHVLV